MDSFCEYISPSPDDAILDVGGYPYTWTSRPQIVRRIDCLNVHEVNWPPQSVPDHQITCLIGDGCSLHFPDGSYDVVFSNSVIEHVGNWKRQCAFASEARRVGRKLWIQTPAYECPLEPHYLAPFVHWLPVSVRRICVRWLTPWGWITRPSKAEVDKTISHTCLLTKRQMRELFPDCTLLTERLFGVFPKSYVAYRTGGDALVAAKPGPSGLK